MNFFERLSAAKDAGPQYLELSEMFDAASTNNESRLKEFRESRSPSVRFAAHVNPLTKINLEKLYEYPLIKYSAVFNDSTSTEVLDTIGLNKTELNPIIPEKIFTHPNASHEFKMFFGNSNLTGKTRYDVFGDEDDAYKFFHEAILDDEELVRSEVDLESLEALLYIYLLGYIEAPKPHGEFWYALVEGKSPNNLAEILRLFGNLPAIPNRLYDQCETIVGARCLAGEFSDDIELLRSLIWDNVSIYTGSSGNLYQDSRSPRSSVAINPKSPPDLLREIFEIEKLASNSLNWEQNPAIWRLTCNTSTPEDVLSEIVSLFEENQCDDEIFLVGYPDQGPGLFSNTSVRGDLRNRVESLIRQRSLEEDAINNLDSAYEFDWIRISYEEYQEIRNSFD